MAVFYLSEDQRCDSVSPCFLPTSVINDTPESCGFDMQCIVAETSTRTA